MEWDQVKINWRAHYVSAKQRWEQFDDADLTVIGGDRDKLMLFLQDTYGMGKEEAEIEAEMWRDGLTDSATLVIANSVPEADASAKS